jgi:uncharacterized coiled-coil protein SlyX
VKRNRSFIITPSGLKFRPVVLYFGYVPGDRERVKHRKNKEQAVTISDLKANAAMQGEIIGRQQKQIEALTAGLQKVSAQLELSKPARGVGKAYSFQPEIISSARKFLRVQQISAEHFGFRSEDVQQSLSLSIKKRGHLSFGI